MGWITDLLKEVPLSAVLKEKIATIEAKNAQTEAENASLKDDLREAKAEIAKLKNQIEAFPHKDDLNETEIKILQIAATDQQADADIFAPQLGITPERATYHLNRLVELNCLEFIGFGGDGIYLIQQKGLTALVSRGLI